MSVPFIEENDQTRARHEHLEALRALVGNVYPNKFERSEVVESGKEDTITVIVEKYRGFQPTAPEGERPAAEAIELVEAPSIKGKLTTRPPAASTSSRP